MDRFTRKTTPAIGSGILALLGAAYCVAVELGLGEALCVTNGCSLYQNFSLYGISLWHVGGLTFLILAGLCFTGRASLALNLSRLTIIADCFLLLLMALTSPCLACMGAAVFLALVFYSLHRTVVTNENHKPFIPRSRLLMVWLLLMFAAALVMVKELTAPTAWHGPEDAPIRLYFSPYCPACIKAVEGFADSPTPVAYHPVAVSLDEVKVIIALEQDLKRGLRLADALRKYKNNPPASLPLNLETLDTLWQILRNRADVLAMGKGSVPLILINGVPQDAAPATPRSDTLYTPPAAPQGQNTPAPAPVGTSLHGILNLNTSQCEETPNAPPCPEPATPGQ